MRLLYVITRAEIGGGQTHVADLIRGFRDELDLHLAVGEEGYLTEVAERSGVPFHIAPNLIQPTRPIQDFKAYHELAAIIREVQPDLVHSHTSKAGILARLAAKRCGVASVFTAHSWAFSEGVSKAWKAIGIPSERLAARWSSRIINVSEANRKLALSYSVGEPDRLVTIHNGIEDNPLRARPAEASPVRIVMVARFVNQKNQGLLVEAAARIKHLPFRVIFAGDGPTRPAVETLVRDHGLTDRVDFLGDRLDIPEILAGSSIFALTTKWEGFPISILEAMRAGLPVVASDAGGIREAVRQQHTGMVTPRGSLSEEASSVAGALSELITRPELREQYGAAGRRRFEEEFTVSAMLGKTLEVYRACLAEIFSEEARRNLPYSTEAREGRFPK